MKTTIHEGLLRRRLGEHPRKQTKIRDLYGDRSWVNDLDIVNELGGHTGCVNALSWSRDGRFLASGSDDTYLNIWSYNPESLAKPFSLSASVSTGHSANIFGVKFAPHSNNRTLITCAGDSQVRVFDIEYGGNYENSSSLDSTRSRACQEFFSSAKFLSVGNTNARIYKSHSHRVKKIVTESSPYTFLTCSEDGDVRQWDLRQPSSTYPAPRGGTAFRSLRPGRGHDADNAPPPLISYKKYSLDLNSISCAASQPYYIALGGAHSHCFLHDRRMLGRDLMAERGQGGSNEEPNMDHATRCVKRFAPNDEIAMGAHSNGHITSCKISDANPNELIASWSGDHIYSFDIVQSPDIRDVGRKKEKTLRENHAAARQQKDRKKKKAKRASSSEPSESTTARMRSGQNGAGDSSLRVRYGNGQSEAIPVDTTNGDIAIAGNAPDALLSEAQKLGQRVARSLVELRGSVFDFEASLPGAATLEVSTELTPHTARFTTILGQAAALLPQIDDIIRDWSYPMNPSPEDVMLQNTLRRNRQATRRFVQASGCLAIALGGRLQTLSPLTDLRNTLFKQIEPAQREGTGIDDNQRFCYDFLKAILVWLSRGHDAVLEAFREQPNQFRGSRRFPLAADDGLETIDTKFISYLMDLVIDDKPIFNIDANRFETQESRTIFESKISAVDAFARALEVFRSSRKEMETNPQPSESSFSRSSLDLGVMCRFWGLRVGRSLLMEASEGVNYEFVKRAFGGLRVSVAEEVAVDQLRDVNVEDESVNVVDVAESSDPTKHNAAEEDLAVSGSPVTISGSSETRTHTRTGYADQDNVMGEACGATVTSEGPGDTGDDGTDNACDDEHHEDDDDDDDVASSLHEHEASDDDYDGEDGPGGMLFGRTVSFGGSQERAKVEFDKPYSSHSLTYRGHCNVKTVKDVNFYGLNDEYVVSGSDSGHFMIWDRKTAELVNILEGDGEVVNVVTGHPYEPMIAASGIDSTIKIFSPDERLQEEARQGINIATPPAAPMHSSLRFQGPMRRSSQAVNAPPDASPTGLTSRKAMHKSYEIMSQNDIARRDGLGDAYLTRGMLARLAAHLQNQGAEPGEALLIDDQCNVM